MQNNYFYKFIKKNESIVISIKKISASLTITDFNYKNQAIDVLLFGDNSRNITFNNKHYQPMMDSVREELEFNGLRCLYLDIPFSLQNSKHVFGISGTINRGYFLSWLLDLFLLSGQKYRTSFYEKVITSTKAKFIFMFNAPKPLCIAAHHRGIHCIELLHGIGISSPVPWKWEERFNEELPTHILSLDGVSTQTFSALITKGVKVIQIEHPLIKRFFLDKFVQYLPPEWMKTFEDKKKRKLILISLQWGYDGECPEFAGILENGILHTEFQELIKKTSHEIFWGFRLHPSQLDESRYLKHLNHIKFLTEKYENTDWEWFTYNPLPTVLKSCSAHITMMSTTSYEAAYMGVPTLALCPTLQPYGINQLMFNDLVEEGYLTKMTMHSQSVLDWSKKSTKIDNWYNVEDDILWQKFLSDIHPNSNKQEIKSSEL